MVNSWGAWFQKFRKSGVGNQKAGHFLTWRSLKMRWTWSHFPEYPYLRFTSNLGTGSEIPERTTDFPSRAIHQMPFLYSPMNNHQRRLVQGDFHHSELLLLWNSAQRTPWFVFLHSFPSIFAIFHQFVWIPFHFHLHFQIQFVFFQWLFPFSTFFPGFCTKKRCERREFLVGLRPGARILGAGRAGLTGIIPIAGPRIQVSEL